MKKIFEWIGGFALIAFSFYFTDQVSLLVATKSDLMSEIKSVSIEYELEPVNAEINGDKNTIIPGRNGRKVNNKESYLAMKEFGAFNENYLVYEKIKPKTSLEDNKDKFITGGNPKNRSVSFIIDNNSEIIKYLRDNNIKYDIIAKNTDEINDISAEYINGAENYENFKTINSKIDKNICIVDYSDIKTCLKYKYYIIEPELKLTGSNIINIKGALHPGSLILVSNSVEVDHIKLLLSEIKYKDLSIEYVSDLIKEETE